MRGINVFELAQLRWEVELASDSRSSGSSSHNHDQQCRSMLYLFDSDVEIIGDDSEEEVEEEDCAVTAVVAPLYMPLELDIEPTNRLRALIRDSGGKNMPDFRYFANAQEGKMRPIVRTL
ncbi:hypothetical protein BJ742DRAFT_779632 [Cladochytrium replicatum]|nr:hypothetical protein BJ742DRAFT_779632 [Cladochytrium replicatum]